MLHRLTKKKKNARQNTSTKTHIQKITKKNPKKLITKKAAALLTIYNIFGEPLAIRQDHKDMQVITKTGQIPKEEIHRGIIT